MTFEKREVFTVDTGKERNRISKAFKEDKETRDKLNEFMNLVEAQEWKKAYDELEGEWWQGDDKEDECPRLEFIGFLHVDGKPWVSYIDLVYAMNAGEENTYSSIRVLNTEK